VDPNARAAVVAVTDDADLLAARAIHDDDPAVRAVAIAALVRIAPRRVSALVWRRVAHDHDARVRRRAAEVAPKLGRDATCGVLLDLLADADTWVAEAAAYAIGEQPRPTHAAVTAVSRAATEHADPLVREAAVAALGALGVPETLPAVLAACDDKPAIRRRAVLALAAFEGAPVEDRLRVALTDNDWQVRQAAEDLLAVSLEDGEREARAPEG
jgi:HEAT repeat protein